MRSSVARFAELYNLYAFASELREKFSAPFSIGRPSPRKRIFIVQEHEIPSKPRKNYDPLRIRLGKTRCGRIRLVMTKRSRVVDFGDLRFSAYVTPPLARVVLCRALAAELSCCRPGELLDEGIVGFPPPCLPDLDGETVEFWKLKG